MFSTFFILYHARGHGHEEKERRERIPPNGMWSHCNPFTSNSPSCHMHVQLVTGYVTRALDSHVGPDFPCTVLNCCITGLALQLVLVDPVQSLSQTKLPCNKKQLIWEFLLKQKQKNKPMLVKKKGGGQLKKKKELHSNEAPQAMSFIEELP